MPNYVTDTHPLIWHLTADARLSGRVRQIFDETDLGHHTIWIPSIVLVEILYISEKRGVLPEAGGTFLDVLAGALNYVVDPLDWQTLMSMQSIPRNTIKDMPDRIIAATSIKLGFPLISIDSIITNSGLVSVVW